MLFGSLRSSIMSMFIYRSHYSDILWLISTYFCIFPPINETMDMHFNQELFNNIPNLHIYKFRNARLLYVFKVKQCLCPDTFHVSSVSFNAHFTTSTHALHRRFHRRYNCIDECLIVDVHSNFPMNASSQVINIVERTGINLAFQIAPQTSHGVRWGERGGHSNG